MKVTNQTVGRLGLLLAAKLGKPAADVTVGELLEHAGERVENEQAIHIVLMELLNHSVTQAYQAVALDVTVRTIANFYSGARRPTYLQLAKLMEVCHDE